MAILSRGLSHFRHLAIASLFLATFSTVQAGPLPQAPSDEDFYPGDEKKEALGRLLAFDKILSGNLNISCLTCHHPLTWLGDGLSLPVGEGGVGLGVTRNTGSGADAVHERVPRNAPHIFMLGAKEFTRMFYDGRVEVDPSHPSGFSTPAGDDLPSGLDNVLAAQAMFPVNSPAEMAGNPGENPVADAVAAGNLAGPDGMWAQLAGRVQAIPEYVTLFIDAFADVGQAADITYVHIANAVAAFEAAAWRCDNSPFDAYLRGDPYALTRQQRRGLRLFYGKAGCDDCHSGKFQTDQQFHAIAIPQIGPGKGDNQDGYSDGHDDFGREGVTGDPADRFKFRTPTLRMIAQTAPYGHDGAFNSLRAVVEHQVNSVRSLENYDTGQAVLPPREDLDLLDFVVQNDPLRRAVIGAASELPPLDLTEEEIDDLVAFLRALTDPDCVDLQSDVPIEGVPSGLPVAE